MCDILISPLRRLFTLKKFLLTLTFIVASLLWLPDNSEASSGKVGVIFSNTIEKYADATHPGGTYTLPFATSSTTVSAKGDLSSIHDKALKMYYLYEQSGYTVSRVDASVLNDLNKMNEYDTLVFAYTVLMNQKQRENLKTYLYGGGNAQFLFDTGRNELNKVPTSSSQMDLTPLIYDALTWVFEWDNLTEVYQGRFVDDVVLENSKIVNTPGVTHPILTNAYKKLGRNYIQLNNKNREWFEIVVPYSGSAVTQVLTISDFSSTDKPNNVTKGKSGALYALEYGAGRIAYAPFKIYDFLQIDAADADWHDGGKGSAWYGHTGDDDVKAVLTSSLDWLLEGSSTFKPRAYDVSLSVSNGTANMTPAKKFALRGTVNVRNNGNIPARGKLRVQALDTSGKTLGYYEKVLVGLTPASYTANAGYDEKFEILLPGTIQDGNYKLKVTFEETRHDRSGYITRAEVYTMTKKGNYGSYGSFGGFKDVAGSNSHYKNIMNAGKIGIITGYNDGSFLPNATVSRLNAMMMMLRAINISPSSSATLPSTVTDLQKGQYGYDVMATAYQRGLINLENGQATPNNPMRRGEMAQALVKGFGLQGTSTLTFTDIGTETSYAQYNNIATLFHHRITTGTTATTYEPYTIVTRGQFASFVMRALENTSK